jgi:glycosyltransferase involved in cell wall biosynthesis
MLDPWFDKAYPLKRLKKSVYWLLFESFVFRHARSIFFTTPQEMKLVPSYYSFNCSREVVGYSISDPLLGYSSSCGNLFLSKYPALSKKKILLSVGRLSAKKGLDLLIKAFASCTSTSSEYVLVIAGPASSPRYLSYLQKLCSDLAIDDRVVWLPMVSGQFKWDLFNSAYAFCLTSHQENFGVVIAEALSCSLPVLTTNSVNIHSYISDYSAGIVSTTELTSITSVLSALLSLSDNAYNATRSNARNLFLSEFDSLIHAPSLIDILRKYSLAS